MSAAFWAKTPPQPSAPAVFSLSNVMVQYQINMLDVDAIAAFTAYFKVELIIYLPIVALGQALMTFTGQNAGAGNWSRTRSGTRVSLCIGIGTTTVLSAVTLALGIPLFRVFHQEPEVISLGLQVIGISFPFYFLYVILQVLGDTLRGLGQTRAPMLIVMANICIIRTALLFVLVPWAPEIRTVAAVYPICLLYTSRCV